MVGSHERAWWLPVAVRLELRRSRPISTLIHKAETNALLTLVSYLSRTFPPRQHYFAIYRDEGQQNRLPQSHLGPGYFDVACLDSVARGSAQRDPISLVRHLLLYHFHQTFNLLYSPPSLLAHGQARAGQRGEVMLTRSKRGETNALGCIVARVKWGYHRILSEFADYVVCMSRDDAEISDSRQRRAVKPC